MCMLAETLTIAIFMACTIICMILIYSISKQLIKKLPKYMVWMILSSYIVFAVITFIVWTFAYDYVYTYMEKVARLILGT